jgi:hypothetical protein
MIEYINEMWRLALNGEKQGIVFFASVYVFILLGYSLVYQLRITKWPVAKGKLLVGEVEKINGTHPVLSEQEYVSKALYEYQVDGTDYKGSRVSPWVIVASHNAKIFLHKQMDKIQRNDDGSVEVYYAPSKPNKSFLIKPSTTGMLVTAVLGVVPIVLYGLSYHL